MKNRHGLSRAIPSDVKVDVRQRSKFACVICRAGFYQYEHIEPEFSDALVHDPRDICCLCASCHDRVTRGQLSKAAVRKSYEAVQAATDGNVGPPVGPLDFHDGSAQLAIGGLTYSPGVTNVLRYLGHDLIRVVPGTAGEPGKISALFTGPDGQEIFGLEENEWVGTVDVDDLEIVGRRLRVKPRNAGTTLRLRLEPPGTVVVEHLDMRIGDAHILVSETTYAVGRYLTEERLYWMHAALEITHPVPDGAAIEIIQPGPEGVVLVDGQARPNLGPVLASGVGVTCPALGVVIGARCGGFRIYQYAHGSRTLKSMRDAINDNPDRLWHFIGTGAF